MSRDPRPPSENTSFDLADSQLLERDVADSQLLDRDVADPQLLDRNATPTEPLGLESGLEALRSSPEFRGPVEPLDGQAENEHIALIYEHPEEPFAATVPFVRQGLERGERCMYIVDETAEVEVIEAMRVAGIGVEEALASGALTFHTVQETYLRNGAFDPDEMIAFYADVIAETTEAYAALRVTAETSWILDDETTIAKFMAYESRVNDLFRDEDAIALCQYDRESIPPDVLCDIICTHPHLIYDNTVCHNFYYTPPGEFFEPDRPARDVDRMLGTLLDRTQAKVELAETVRDLQQSNDRLKRFAYIASHDLQEPLRMVSSYLQLLEGRYGAELDDEAQEFIGFAVDGADRMREMIEGLLAYSRIDMHDPTFEPVACEAVLENVVTDLQVAIDERDAEVVVGSLPTVLGDANQLEQVFGNLVSNAIKYTDDEPPHVEITAHRRGDRWAFSVADDGIGIDPAYADQIFEVFNRLHTEAAYPGTGIGLSLCKKIVRHHGGEIWVDSEPGAGSTFTFTLPTVGEERTQGGAVASNATPTADEMGSIPGAERRDA